MDLRTIQCPTCRAGHQFYLSTGDGRHLRRCPDCGHWFVAEERPDGEEPFDLTGLEDPPECPVEGCAETPPANDLPAHVIAAHDGSLTSEAE